MFRCWLRQLKPCQWLRSNFLIDACFGDGVGVETKIALAVGVINLTMSVLSHLQFVDLHLHLPILLDQLFHVSDGN